MRRWLAGAALVLGLASGPAPAANQATPFEKLVVIHPAYQSVRLLEKHGFPTGTQEGTFDGKREVTRYEFALAIERIYRSLQPRILGASEAGSLREDLAAFRELFREFEPELAALGPAVVEIRSQTEAMAERLARLQEHAPKPAANPAAGVDSAGVLAAALSRPGYQPVRDRLRRSYREQAVGRATGLDLVSPPVGASRRPVYLTGAGPFTAGFNVRRPDPLTTVANLPLSDPAAGTSFGAHLSAALGSYLVTAFYNRIDDAGQTDRFRLWNPYFPATGGLEAFGGSLSKDLNDRLAFQLETATLSGLAHDPSRMLYLKGGLSYQMQKRLTVLLGMEWMKGVGYDQDTGSAYFLGVEHSLGSFQLDFLLRRYNQSRGGVGAGDSSAITQISVRF